MALEGEKIAVAGARGFVGRHLVNALLTDGAEPLDIGRVCECTPELVRQLSGCAALINCAGRIGIKDKPESWFANAELPVLLLEAARGAGVARFVHLSSVASTPYAGGSVEAARSSLSADPYGSSKAGGEIGLRDAAGDDAPDIVIVRPPVIYGAGAGGPAGMLISAAAKGLPMPWKDFTARRSMISVHNVVHALRQVARGRGAGTFVVCEPAPYSTAQFYDAFCAAFGYPPRSFGTPGRLFARAAMAIRGPFSNLIENAVFDCDEFTERFGALPFDLQDAASRTAADHASGTAS